MYFYQHSSGDAQADNGTASLHGGQEDAYEITLTGAVPMVDGLSAGVGYANLSNATLAGNDSRDQNEGTAYVKYSVGGLSIGGQRSVVNVAGTNTSTFHTDYIGISYAVSDNLSVSYNEIESTKEIEAGEVTQDLDSISISYTMGGMTIGILDADSTNSSYTTGSDNSARSISLSVAF